MDRGPPRRPTPHEIRLGREQRGEHVSHSAGAVECGAQPGRVTGREPTPPWAWLQVQRAELIDADPPVDRWPVIQVEDAGYLRGEVRVLSASRSRGPADMSASAEQLLQ